MNGVGFMVKNRTCVNQTPKELCDLLVLMILMALGPYVIPSMGVRSEQLCVYIGGAAMLMVVLLKKPRLSVSNILVGTLWLFILAISTVVALSHGRSISNWTIVARIDSRLTGLIVLFMTGCHESIVSRSTDSMKHSLATVSRALTLLLVVNSVWGLAALVLPTEKINSLFWTGNTERGSVGANALSMGRLTGIFNQPAEAGQEYHFSKTWPLDAHPVSKCDIMRPFSSREAHCSNIRCYKHLISRHPIAQLG
jgi:hypothetical protein